MWELIRSNIIVCEWLQSPVRFFVRFSGRDLLTVVAKFVRRKSAVDHGHKKGMLLSNGNQRSRPVPEVFRRYHCACVSRGFSWVDDSMNCRPRGWRDSSGTILLLVLVRRQPVDVEAAMVEHSTKITQSGCAIPCITSFPPTTSVIATSDSLPTKKPMLYYSTTVIIICLRPVASLTSTSTCTCSSLVAKN